MPQLGRDHHGGDGEQQSMLSPQNFSLAKANPASVEKNIMLIETVAATTKEFHSARPKGAVSKTRITWEKKLPPGTSGGGTSASIELRREATTTL